MVENLASYIGRQADTTMQSYFMTVYWKVTRNCWVLGTLTHWGTVENLAIVYGGKEDTLRLNPCTDGLWQGLGETSRTRAP